ncbi:SEL1-like repeat protein [soil metagenome]
MSAAAPWSVKGIDPKAREVAKDLARRSGMTLGEWLNTMIMDDEDDGVTPLPRRPHAADAIDRRGRARRLDDAYDQTPFERSIYNASDDTLQRVAASVDAMAARLEAAERRSTVAIQGVDQAVAGLVRRLDGSDQQTRAYGRRIDDISEELKEGHRRLRSFEKEVGPETKATFGKVETGLGAIASRLYDIEERQRTSVNELRQRMDTVEKTARPGPGTDQMAQVGARLDTAQAKTTEALRGLERSFAGLDQRLRAAEGRVEPEGLREGARFEKLAETLARQVETNRTEMMRRLDAAEAEGRMERIDRAVASLGESLKTAEQRSAQGIEAMGREVMRIAQNLSGRVHKVEAEGATVADRLDLATTRKIDGAVQALTTTLTAGLTEKVERDMGRYAQAVEQRLNRTDDQHAMALEKLGGEITRISDRLADRIAQSERKSAQALEDIGRRLADSSDRIEQTYDRASGELSERMRLSEERTVRLLDEARERLDSRAARVERDAPAVAAPVVSATVMSAPVVPVWTSPAAQTAVADLQQPDWRAAAFPDDFGPGKYGSADPIDAVDAWSTDGFGAEPAPFPTLSGPTPSSGQGSSSGAVRAETMASARQVQPDAVAAEPVFASDPIAPVFAETSAVTGFGAPPFGTEPMPRAVMIEDAAPAMSSFAGFGGADVSDALDATAPQAFGSARSPQAAFDAGSVATSTFDGGDDVFSAETEFVDARSLRAGLAVGAANGRTSSTRNAIDAARASMTTPKEAEPVARGAFGLKRGGKSRLQERLDKQATTKQGSTIRKALLASATGVAVITAGFATLRLTGHDPSEFPGLDGLKQAMGLSASTPGLPSTTTPMLAVALSPTDATPALPSEAQTLFDQGIEQIDSGQPGGVATLTRAANLGLPAAQLKLVSLYESGDNGVGINLTEARTWARRAAESSDPRGMHAYGMYLFDGVGGARNRPEALNWLLKAADRGLVDSQYNVAHIYETGDEGIAANATEAFKWYLIAARSGDQQAQSSVERLTPELPSAGRRTARAAADAFQVEPLA